MTPQEAAEWMLEQYETNSLLYQEEAATHLLLLDDEELAYYDINGNLCVGKKVLAIFRRLTPEAVYERAYEYWRAGLPGDQPGRQQ